MREARDSEIAALGCAMLDGACARDIAASITQEMMSQEASRSVLAAVVSLVGESSPVDPVSVCERMTKDGTLESAGGKGYIVKAVHSIATVEHYGYYVSSIRRAFYWRKIEECAEKIQADPDDEKEMVRLQEFAYLRAS